MSVNDQMGRSDPHTKSVLLIEPDRLVCHALIHVLDKWNGYQVSAQCTTFDESLKALRSGSYDLVVMELGLSEGSGVELLREIAGQFPAIVNSSIQSEKIVARAIYEGAKGYVLKTSELEHLRIAMDTVSEGGEYFVPEVAGIKEDLSNGRLVDFDDRSTDAISSLSPREREVFSYIAMGLPNVQIAKKLYISPRTVETHRAQIVRKLNLKSNGELIRFAIRNGLTTV